MKYQWGPRAGPEFPPTALWWASARMEIPGSPTAISTPPFGELPLPPFIRKQDLELPSTHTLKHDFGQDRSVSFVPPHGKGDIRICWPSDERIHKAHQTANHTRLPSLRQVIARGSVAQTLNSSKTSESPAHSHKTPERPAFERHQWTVDGQTYGLYWIHRHTGVSNCRTGFDGSS